MILIMFGIGVAFMLIMLFMGMNQGSFPLLYLGFFTMLILGMFIMSDGLEVEDGIQKNINGAYVTTYVIHTAANDPVVNIIANAFFYFPFAAILLTTLYAIKQ